MSATVLLTATISPADVIYCDRRDVNARLFDYARAVQFWSGEAGVSKLVFVENSGSDLSQLESIAASRHRSGFQHEFLSYTEFPFSRDLGKSYGEMQILKFAFANSRLLATSDVVLKGTGRYLPTNFFRVWPKTCPVQSNEVVANFYKEPTIADSRFFAAPPDFYVSHLFRELDKVDDSRGYYMEHALATAISSFRTLSHGHHRPWPGGGFLVDGVQGSTNTSFAYPYATRMLYRAIARVRNGLPFSFKLGAPVRRPDQGSKT